MFALWPEFLYCTPANYSVQCETVSRHASLAVCGGGGGGGPEMEGSVEAEKMYST
jgi:hypothetical protein